MDSCFRRNDGIDLETVIPGMTRDPIVQLVSGRYMHVEPGPKSDILSR